MSLAAHLVGAATLYGYAGLAVAALFLTVGIDRIDEDSRGAYAFRPLLIPGTVLIWPLVLWRWWQYESGRDDWRARYGRQGRAHGTVALVMAVLVVGALLTGRAVHQTWPADVAPVRISEAEG